MDRDEIVFEQYYEDVYRFLRALTRDRDLAEELTQETFLRAIRSIDTYRGEGGVGCGFVPSQRISFIPG